MRSLIKEFLGLEWRLLFLSTEFIRSLVNGEVICPVLQPIGLHTLTGMSIGIWKQGSDASDHSSGISQRWLGHPFVAQLEHPSWHIFRLGPSNVAQCSKVSHRYLNCISGESPSGEILSTAGASAVKERPMMDGTLLFHHGPA